MSMADTEGGASRLPPRELRSSPSTMEDQQSAAAAAVADAALDAVVQTPTSATKALNREAEIDEVMDFLRFSVKPSTTFEGAILFNFRNDRGENVSTYLVHIAGNREVTTKKNGTVKDIIVTCEVSMTMDDFLWIYSGKASNSDVLKLFYSGRLSISGYAFRKVSNFAQSFDFSSEKWLKFYEWRDQENTIRRSPGALDEANNIGSPSRDFWFYYCRAVLERHSICKLQRMAWEASLASLFGDQFILDNLRRSVSRRRSFGHPQGHHGEMQGLIAGLVGLHTAPSCVERELTHFFHPRIKRRHSCGGDLKLARCEDAPGVFDFFDEAYVNAVKTSAKRRQQRARNKNRVDLADAGMEQLDKLLKAIGKDGHSNKQRKTKPKYIPAPEILLREFRAQASEVMTLIKEKALGHKSVDRIPLPDTAWLLGSDSGVLVVSGDCAPQSHKNTESTPPMIEQQALVIVDRSQIQRRGSRRDFEASKQLLRAKLVSFSRDLALHHAHAESMTADEHLIFSDYV